MKMRWMRTQFTRQDFIENRFPGREYLDEGALPKRGKDLIVQLLGAPGTWTDLWHRAKPGPNMGPATVDAVRRWIDGGEAAAQAEVSECL